MGNITTERDRQRASSQGMGSVRTNLETLLDGLCQGLDINRAQRAGWSSRLSALSMMEGSADPMNIWLKWYYSGQRQPLLNRIARSQRSSTNLINESNAVMDKLDRYYAADAAYERAQSAAGEFAKEDPSRYRAEATEWEPSTAGQLFREDVQRGALEAEPRPQYEVTKEEESPPESEPFPVPEWLARKYIAFDPRKMEAPTGQPSAVPGASPSMGLQPLRPLSSQENLSDYQLAQMAFYNASVKAGMPWGATPEKVATAQEQAVPWFEDVMRHWQSMFPSTRRLPTARRSSRYSG